MAVKQALKSAVIEGYNTKQEKISLDFGDGDLIDIKIGHAYRDTHRNQRQGKVAHLIYTSKEDIVASIVSGSCLLMKIIKGLELNFLRLIVEK